MQNTFAVGIVKPCCADEKNNGPVERSGPSETFRRCQVCQCRHFRFVVDPGKYKAVLSPIGGKK